MPLHPSWPNSYSMCLVLRENRLFFQEGGGVLCTVRNVRCHQLVGEVTTTRKSLVRQLVSLSDLSADKPAGSSRRLFGIRRHDTQCFSALPARRPADGAANNYGIKATAVEPNNMMWCFTLQQLHITVGPPAQTSAHSWCSWGVECFSPTSSSLSFNAAIFTLAGYPGDTDIMCPSCVGAGM